MISNSNKPKFTLLSLSVVWILSAQLVVAADTTPNPDQPNTQNKIYKQVGPNGEVIYSDKPTPNSEEIQAPPTSDYKPVQQPPSFTPYQAPRKTTKIAAENTVTIISPKSEEGIWSGDGSVTISVSLGSPLRSGQHLEYQIDGATMYSGNEISHTFTNIYRGAHVVTVQLIDSSGKSVSSPPLTFYMQRPSIRR